MFISIAISTNTCYMILNKLYNKQYTTNAIYMILMANSHSRSTTHQHA